MFVNYTLKYVILYFTDIDTDFLEHFKFDVL